MDRREINHFIKVEYTLRFPKNIVLGKSMIGKHSVFYWYSEISKDFVRVAVFYNFQFCAVHCISGGALSDDRDTFNGAYTNTSLPNDMRLAESWSCSHLLACFDPVF